MPTEVILFVAPVMAGLMNTVAFGVGLIELDGIAGTVQVIVVFTLLLIPVNTILGSLQLKMLNGCMKLMFGAMVFCMILMDCEEIQLLV